MGQQAIQPGAVDLFGRRHALQAIQGMGLVVKKSTGPALLALLQILGVGLGHFGAALLHPGGQMLRHLGQVAGQLTHLGQLRLHKIPCGFSGALGFAVQLLVQGVITTVSRMMHRGRLA